MAASQVFIHETVSVPLRGNGYRKCHGMAGDGYEVWKFPSPCGVMVIGNFKPKDQT